MLWKYVNVDRLSRETVYIVLEPDYANRYEPLLTENATCL